MVQSLLQAIFVFFTFVAYPRFEVPTQLKYVIQLNGNCSGFVAAPNIIFTASHCIRDRASDQEVVFYDGLAAKFHVIAIGKPDNTDYAILSGDTRGIEPALLSDSTSYPEDETPCISVGHGGGNPRQLGALCEVRPPLKNWPGYIVMSASVIGGDSGSLVMERTEPGEQGRVFGIVVRSSYPVPVSLAVPIHLARRALRAYLRTKI